MSRFRRYARARGVSTGLLLYCTFGMARHVASAQAMQIDDGGQVKPARAQHVFFEQEPVRIAPGKPVWVELRFQVAPGFHINSHEPHDELLTPTTLHLVTSPQFHALKQEYPPGKPLQLPIGAGETLSTYDGEFRIRVQIVAERSEGPLTGTLHYQACNTVACFPPRDLPIEVPLSAQ